MYIGLSWWLRVKQMPAVQETWVRSLGWEGPLEEEMATHSSVLAWRIHGQRSMAGYSPWGLQKVGHNLATKPYHHRWNVTCWVGLFYLLLSS